MVRVAIVPMAGNKEVNIYFKHTKEYLFHTFLCTAKLGKQREMENGKKVKSSIYTLPVIKLRLYSREPFSTVNTA